MATATLNVEKAKKLLNKHQHLRMKTLAEKHITKLHYWIAAEIEAFLQWQSEGRILGLEEWNEDINNHPVRTDEERAILATFKDAVARLYV